MLEQKFRPMATPSKLPCVLGVFCGVVLGLLLTTHTALYLRYSEVDYDHSRMHAQLSHLGGRTRRGRGAMEIELAGVWPGPGEQDTFWIDNSPEGITPIIHQIWDDDVVETTCQVRFEEHIGMAHMYSFACGAVYPAILRPIAHRWAQRRPSCRPHAPAPAARSVCVCLPPSHTHTHTHIHNPPPPTHACSSPTQTFALNHLFSLSRAAWRLRADNDTTCMW